jgi:hypothetical protein
MTTMPTDDIMWEEEIDPVDHYELTDEEEEDEDEE